MVIYLATNQENGKVYVGQTTRTLPIRMKQHISRARGGDDHCFARALLKYGLDGFDWEIIRECDTIEALNKLEQYYISILDSTKKEYGYNRTEGGMGSVGYKPSAKTLIKLSKAAKGRKHTEEVKKVISEASKKRWEDPEYRAKMPDMRGENHPMFGKRHTPESIQQMIDNMPNKSGENNPFWGKCHTSESIAKMREWKPTKETRGRMKQGQLKRFANPQERLKISDKMKQVWTEKKQKNLEGVLNG